VAICALAALACDLSPTPTQTALPQPTHVVSIPTILPSEPPTPDVTATPAVNPAYAELEQFGVSLVSDGALTNTQIDPVVFAVRALSSKISALDPDGPQAGEASTQTFIDVFSHTMIRVYLDRTTIDGKHVAVNCGWEGRFSAGCKTAEIYPEQEFPDDAWLILVSGRYLDSTVVTESTGLIAHELIHNLTWGGGHLPPDVNGYSYVRYVGDDFALDYIDYLGVQVGRDTYWTEAARAANADWRAELNADSFASWSLDLIEGPDAKAVNRYITNYMICRVYGVGNCR
jgi:hypothetical protein